MLLDTFNISNISKKTTTNAAAKHQGINSNMKDTKYDKKNNLEN